LRDVGRRFSRRPSRSKPESDEWPRRIGGIAMPALQPRRDADPHFPYTGVLDKVTITPTGDDTDRVKEVDGTAELD
jgi:hypothetical protein